MRRWPWQNEFGETSPGWALMAVISVVLVVALGVQWLNDMHMNGYGLFGR